MEQLFPHSVHLLGTTAKVRAEQMFLQYIEVVFHLLLGGIQHRRFKAVAIVLHKGGNAAEHILVFHPEGTEIATVPELVYVPVFFTRVNQWSLGLAPACH